MQRLSENDLKLCQTSHSELWGAFKIPQVLCTPTQAVQPSALLALPTELLLEIFGHVAPVEKLFLALTCKRLLTVSSMVTIEIPSAPKHRNFARKPCRAMLGLLHGMRRGISRDITNSSAVCHDCYRYRPKKKKFWSGVEKRYSAAKPRVVETWYCSQVEFWCRERIIPISIRCPECWSGACDKYKEKHMSLT
ncbi:hypothetical protein F4679DRAFT_589111 [Xylaria curta]|nr:hypothetical protein F4679DRAFT_589111 [Xylaria curta]